MNKNDFLDILRDYLKGTFSQIEINDILRDYEEFFLNGELQGKSEEEIIKGLGSPKSIANELIEEMKGQSTSTQKDSSEIFEKVNKEAKRALKSCKIFTRKAGNKAKEFLDSNSIINGNISSSGVKVIINLITIAIIIGAMPVIFTMLGGFLTLIGMSIANFIGYVGAVVLCSISLPMGVFGIFACITWTGFLILGWLLYRLAYKGLKYLWIKYISWVKTRKMYVRVKDKQQSSSSLEEAKNQNEKFENEVDVINITMDNDEENTITEPMFLEEAKDLENHLKDKEGKGHDE